MATVAFRMLGPLEAEVDGRPVALGGPKPRMLLATLLLRANCSRRILYAEWAGSRRERLSALRERVRQALAEAYLAEGAVAEAVGAAEQALATGPVEERVHRVLIAAPSLPAAIRTLPVSR